MVPIAGQPACPNWLTFFELTHGYPGGNIGYKKVDKFYPKNNCLVNLKKWAAPDALA